jgi:Protein of unknown function (DUF2442)
MRVKKVEYATEYKLKLLFSDNKLKIVDIEPIINKSKRLFHPLRDIEYFKKVSLDDDEYPLSICWPNGADICPDVLYEMGEEIKEKKQSQQKHPRKRKVIRAKSIYAMKKQAPKKK